MRERERCVKKGTPVLLVAFLRFRLTVLKIAFQSLWQDYQTIPCMYVYMYINMCETLLLNTQIYKMMNTHVWLYSVCDSYIQLCLFMVGF
jgi:hypothetical protein